MRSVLKWGGIGCGGLVAVIVVIAVISAVVGGGGGSVGSTSPTGQGQGGNGSESGGSEQQPTAAVGESLTVGKTAWTVTNAARQQQLSNEFDTKQGNFVVVDFKFTNNGSESITLDSNLLTLIDGQGREFEVDTDNMMFVPTERSIFLEQVNPGVTKSGTAIFSVAPDAQNFTLEVSEGFFGTNTGMIDLGTL